RAWLQGEVNVPQHRERPPGRGISFRQALDFQHCWNTHAWEPGAKSPVRIVQPMRLLSVLLFFLSATLAPAATARTILFYGDSLTAGYGLEDPPHEAFPGRIQEKITAENLAYRVVNAGLSG